MKDGHINYVDLAVAAIVGAATIAALYLIVHMTSYDRITASCNDTACTYRADDLPRQFAWSDMVCRPLKPKGTAVFCERTIVKENEQ